MQDDTTFLGRLRANLANFGGRLAVMLIGAGLLAILLAWNGAASDIRVAAQLPYVISGLGAGLGLIGVGIALMIIQAAREDRARLETKLDILIDAVTRAGSGLPVAARPPLTMPTAPPAPARASSGAHVATTSAPAPAAAPPADVAPANLAGLVVAGSASYHTPGCKLVDGREEVTYLTPEEAKARWLSPCRVCQPETASVRS